MGLQSELLTGRNCYVGLGVGGEYYGTASKDAYWINLARGKLRKFHTSPEISYPSEKLSADKGEISSLELIVLSSIKDLCSNDFGAGLVVCYKIYY
jgi:hypothetical protein